MQIYKQKAKAIKSFAGEAVTKVNVDANHTLHTQLPCTVKLPQEGDVRTPAWPS